MSANQTCRALRTQQFLAFTAADMAAREVKQKVLLHEFEASRRGKLVSKADLNQFYQRLQVRASVVSAISCSLECPLALHAYGWSGNGSTAKHTAADRGTVLPCHCQMPSFPGGRACRSVAVGYY
jgi:hypothetical protein